MNIVNNRKLNNVTLDNVSLDNELWDIVLEYAFSTASGGKKASNICRYFFYKSGSILEKIVSNKTVYHIKETVDAIINSKLSLDEKIDYEKHLDYIKFINMVYIYNMLDFDDIVHFTTISTCDCMKILIQKLHKDIKVKCRDSDPPKFVIIIQNIKIKIICRIPNVDITLFTKSGDVKSVRIINKNLLKELNSKFTKDEIIKIIPDLEQILMFWFEIIKLFGVFQKAYTNGLYL